MFSFRHFLHLLYFLGRTTTRPLHSKSCNKRIKVDARNCYKFMQENTCIVRISEVRSDYDFRMSKVGLVDIRIKVCSDYRGCTVYT